VRVAEQIAVAQRQSATAARQAQGNAGGGAGGGVKKAINDLLPFAGPGILQETKKAVEAGGSLEEEIAKLHAAGATPDQIEHARADFREFSKTHSGVLEADYLAGFRDARMIAPGESFEMAGIGGLYRTALRNSGLSATDHDVGNVLRMMDELNLKTMPEREHFLDSITRQQQAFGSQISTETMLAAYRNAKQSIYDWSPEFREKYFPTLLQSSGQQGGTEMMTALNNYIGQHMQQSELRALTAAGFVQNSDLLYDKIGNVKGLKQSAQLFEADTFKSNIAQWAWDFHKEFMGGKGATEDKFDDLIARMPRNMAALIAFLVHGEARIKRDATSLDLPIGLKAAEDASLAGNPPAALSALQAAITQFTAAVTGPAVAAAGPGSKAWRMGSSWSPLPMGTGRQKIRRPPRRPARARSAPGLRRAAGSPGSSLPGSGGYSASAAVRRRPRPGRRRPRRRPASRPRRGARASLRASDWARSPVRTCPP